MFNPPSLPAAQSEQANSSQSTSAASNDASTMPPTPSLTLILAATPSLGIGKGGGLPWPQLRKEMGYFARVTKRVSPSSSTSPSSSPANHSVRRINAVLMGRKTWASIPASFRPLRDRVNIVITRQPEAFQAQLGKDNGGVEGPLVCSGIVDALSRLEQLRRINDENVHVERIFVIGGASVYQSALELPQTKRVLLTRIQSEYECDTFFPVDVESSSVWRKVGRDGLKEFTGEDVQDEGVEEKGVKFEFCLYERD
ncbi:uncharacterized protein K460DRAFT_363389 [Cucurbitaria berberidis CBS 394.84]|uniref:Dihydrofolate reductase n=1 Tax=Cucurbitaria berberidis CBS 394.84 TaxID=1168544 RepID=A0A9P4L9R2_9PLEO|nr:uncharacterized protein K460DRAFT_363389 [Cucurbitaria berberidis CBS 394.84]KAF1847295.1 hypothetical protein K460DRAFT_363389 [Cucurbitaria berberidis CBS 394.84]